MQRTLALIGAGVAGALTVTLLNRAGQKIDDRAPRLDLLGKRALRRGLRGLGASPPRGQRLLRLAAAGELLANGLYYSLLFAGRPRAGLRGGIGGAVAGLLAAVAAPALGIAPRRSDAPRRSVMTIAWYTGAGLAAATTYGLLQRDHQIPTQRLPIDRAAL